MPTALFTALMLLLLSSTAPCDAQGTSTSAPKPTSDAGSSLITLIAPVPLDKALLEAPNQIKFDSGEWKNSIDKRQHMLVDFYQQRLLGKSPQEIHALLGEPFNSETNHTFSEFYSLGTHQNKEIFLDVIFLENHLVALSIGEKAPPGIHYIVATKWHWENPNNSDIAKEINQNLYLAGAPVQHLCQIMGHPTKGNEHWTCGPYQFDYTPDQSKVLRFKLVADHTCAIYKDNEWQDQDLRVNKGSYSTAIDMLLLNNPMEVAFTKPMMKFDYKRWQANWSRRMMLFDLTHNFNLVGSNRARIKNMLGTPTFSETTLDSRNRIDYFIDRLSQPEPLNKFDWYRLDSPGCTGSPPITNFELVYKNGIVAGYRIIQANFNQLDGKYTLCEECNDRRGGPVPPLH